MGQAVTVATAQIADKIERHPARRDGDDAGGIIVLMADNNRMQNLRAQLYQTRQVVKGIKEALVQQAKHKSN